MQYTEEQYTELYNSLPKGLRELVLTGQLSILSGSIGMKYNLDKQAGELLETAIEDVCLGIVIPDELDEHIEESLGLEKSVAENLASDARKSILEEHRDELELMRKYKLELDEEIRRSMSKEEKAAAEERTRAENIIKVTRESDVGTPKKADRVSDWYHGYYEEQSSASAPKKIEVKTVATTPEPKVATVPEFIPKPELKKPVENKKVFADFLKEESVPVAAPQTQTVPVVSDPDVSKTVVRLEQQMFNLNQSIQRLVERGAAAQQVVPASDDTRRMYDELAMRFDLLSHKLDEMQKKYQDAQEEIKILKSSKSVAAQKDESTVTTETTSSKEGTSTLTGNPVKITNKMVFASQTSKSAVENIVTQKQPEGKKVLSIDELLTRKTTPAKQPTISITQKPSEDIYTLPKVEPKTEIKQEPRVDLADLLKKDIEYIDSVKSTTDTSATAAPTQSLIKNDLAYG
jgi:hypothetical protein